MNKAQAARATLILVRGAPIATEDMFSKSFSWAVREPGYDSSDVSCLIAQVAREIDRLVRQVYGRVART
ncbi:hypothetical protein [Nonomuraea roseoviolacea]|uniref:DivIVA domain-containing protein n=1 Tax=Nonomuraea roseoviolacea subsp. carminata TaxID=160689 RepID=A0ABT1KBD3_9ACTN|nr:hypothetical protein [Nonomuraea roseoviolacea]MCP2350997.1 hypothetical protein [Nonomuraea roseoviolacea subsp. carminata]